jgi:hypothetical protein
MENPWIVWALTDGAPGHQSQTAGLADALASNRALQLHWLDCRLRFEWLRPLMRLLGPRMPRILQRSLLKYLYVLGTLPDQSPDLILSSGGNTLIAQICIAQISGAKSIYSGTVKASLQRYIDLIITVVPLPGHRANNLVLPLPPVSISLSQKADEQSMTDAEQDQSTKEKVGVVLIGGNGAGVTYDAEDWGNLILAMKDYFPSEIRWLVTTSRRTGQAAELSLSKALAERKSVQIAQAVWWAQKPERVLPNFFQRADFIICTKDSLSMMAEAIYTNKPVFIFAPHNGSDRNMTENDRAAYEAYEKANYIYPLNDRAHLVEADAKRDLLPEVQGLIYREIESLVSGAGDRSGW